MKYRRKSRIVSAVQATESTTLEGKDGAIVYVRPGDWILTDEDGATWPCCDSVFHEYYEPVGG